MTWILRTVFLIVTLVASASATVIRVEKGAFRSTPWVDPNFLDTLRVERPGSVAGQVIRVQAEDSIAGQPSRYRVTLALSLEQLKRSSGGGLAFLFPSTFDLSRLATVNFTCSKSELGLAVSHAVVSGNSLLLTLNPRAGSTERNSSSGTRVEIGLALDGAVNPVRAGEYHVAGCVFGASGRPLGSYAISSSVSIVPGSLAKIILNVTPEQVVGSPFVGTAQVFLLDSNNNRVTNYDIVANPILLVPASGLLSPNLLNNPALMDSGVVNFQPASVRYTGPSANVPIYATVGTLRSENVIMSFSGYNVQSCLTATGSPLRQVYSGQYFKILVTARNSGSLLAMTKPVIAAHFASGGSVVTTPFAASNNGTLDTVAITFPGDLLPAGGTQLVLELSAAYRVGDSIYSTFDRKEFSVEVQNQVTLSVVPGSYGPDTVYAGVEFPFGFDVAVSGVSGSVYSSSLTLQLRSSPHNAISTIFQGPLGGASIANGKISYRSLPSNISVAASPGTYGLRFLYSFVLWEGGTFSVTSDFANAFVVLQPPSIGLPVNPPLPRSLFAGTFASFSCPIMLSDTAPLEIRAGTARLALTGTNFLATADLGFSPADGMLMPGDNVMSAKGPFIPAQELGDSLQVSISFECRNRVSAVFVKEAFMLGERIPVVSPPTLQVVGIRSVSPNPGKVNTSQSFKIACKIANSSSTVARNVSLRLASDGHSTFDSHETVGSIPGYDTIEVFHEIVAAREKNGGEIFSVDIVPTDAVVLPPVNNVALVEIQDPARLALSYTLQLGQSEFVGFDEPFGMTVAMANFGGAEVTEGQYRLDASGFDAPQPGPFTGIIDIRSPVTFNLRAPAHDAHLTLHFVLVTTPLDINTDLPAIVNDSDFSVSITVASTKGDLEITTTDRMTAPVVVGSDASLFKLDITNRGGSQFTDAALERVTFRIADASGGAADLNSLVDVSKTGFYEGSTKLSSVELFADSAAFLLPQFRLPHGETRQLDFRLSVIRALDRGLLLTLDSSGVRARYVEGPLAGQSVPIVKPQRGLIVDASVAATAADFVKAFIIKNNPWHPADGPAVFNYYVDEKSPVAFRILNLGGELVYERILSEGADGMAAGQHTLQWDGRNGNGDMVLNGVYVAMITLEKSGKVASMKVAVIK